MCGKCNGIYAQQKKPSEEEGQEKKESSENKPFCIKKTPLKQVFCLYLIQSLLAFCAN